MAARGAMSMNATAKFRMAEFTEGALARLRAIMGCNKTRAAEAAVRSGTDQILLAGISFDLN